MSTPDFKSAARRHYRDAKYLLDDERWPNADHLAGVAAECGLKAILEGWFGATINPKGILVWGQKQQELRYHVDKLWSELSLNISGRSGPVFASLIAGPAPFSGWDVADRYSDGNAITEQGARSHTDKAREIVEVLEQAEQTGIVP